MNGFQKLKFLYQNQQKNTEYWENKYKSRSWQDYDEITKRELYNHTFRASVDLLIEQCALENNSNVLEIGCGWGRCIIGLRRHFPEIQITGIDLASSVIDKARTIVQGEIGNHNIQFQQGNAEELNFPDESFDAVISTRVFQYVKDPENALKEVYRVLKRNGRVTILVPNKLNPVRFLTYHTQLLTNSTMASWMYKAGLGNVKKGTIVFLPPRIKRFPEESVWVTIDKILSRIPIVNSIGGLAWASGQKLM
jgi:ubiquinone/menaquinone biosynthesis C-methylase UbiE